MQPERSTTSNTKPNVITRVLNRISHKNKNASPVSTLRSVAITSRNGEDEDDRVHPMREPGSLVDRGANNGIARSDMHVISYVFPERTIDAQGIDKYEILRLRIGTFGAVVPT